MFMIFCNIFTRLFAAVSVTMTIAAVATDEPNARTVCAVVCVLLKQASNRRYSYSSDSYPTVIFAYNESLKTDPFIRCIRN